MIYMNAEILILLSFFVPNHKYKIPVRKNLQEFVLIFFGWVETVHLLLIIDNNIL